MNGITVITHVTKQKIECVCCGKKRQCEIFTRLCMKCFSPNDIIKLRDRINLSIEHELTTEGGILTKKCLDMIANGTLRDYEIELFRKHNCLEGKWGFYPLTNYDKIFGCCGDFINKPTEEL